jgi:hypothetical protein
MVNMQTPDTLIGFLPFSLNLKETLSRTLTFGGFEDTLVTYSLIGSRSIKSASPHRPVIKLSPIKTIAFFFSWNYAPN